MENKKIYQKTWFIILMFIVFFPVGIYLMLKYANMPKKIKYSITYIFLGLMFLAIFMSPNKNVNIESSAKTESVTEINEKDIQNTESVVENKEKDIPNYEIIAQSIHNELKDNSSLCKLKDVNVNELVNNECTVIVTLSAKVGYDKESTLSDFNISDKHVFKAVYTSQIPLTIKNCKIVIESELTDTRTGDTKDESIFWCELDKDHADKMKWDNIDNIDITKSLKNVFMHQALKSLK